LSAFSHPIDYFTNIPGVVGAYMGFLNLNWQLFGKMSIFNDDFGSSIPSLSLTLNPDFIGKP